MRAPLWLAALPLALAAPAWAPAWAAATVLDLRGEGVQIYACAASPQGAGWRLQGPEASLLDASGKTVGRHFAGPSWQARDGSTVVGEVLASGASPRPGAVPWLVLRAKFHAGQGAFAAIGSIVRIRTQGGLAPPIGCDAAHLGAQSRVGYQATYLLFPR